MMGRLFRLKIRSLKQLYVFFFIFSLLVALGISIAIFKFTNPYQLRIANKKMSESHEGQSLILYHDFNHDGFSESMNVSNNSLKKKFKIIFLPYYQNTYKVIDQFNFLEPILPEWIFFGDYTDDGYDETIVFTQKKDSLFLSMIDINQKKWILRHQYILSVQKPNPYQIWDIRKIFCHLLDVNNDGRPELVFAIHSGFSQHPRGVFVYDIAKRTFLHRFQFDAGINDLLIYDLNDDGKPEIILAGHATGNIHKKSKYSDFKTWLFVLDQQLHFVFPPKCFGKYPSQIFVSPIETNGDKNLLITYKFAGEENLADFLGLINAKGKMHCKHIFSGWDLKPTLIGQENNKPVIYASSENGKIAILNADLEIQSKTDLKKKGLNIWDLVDLNNDGQTELICTSQDGISILNHKLGTIARFPLKQVYPQGFSKKYNGPKGPVEFALRAGDSTYLFSMERNYRYAYLPFGFIALSILLFFILMLFHRLMTILNIYVNYFLFSLRKSRQGILILDYKGHIFYFNGRAQELLHLSAPILKAQYFGEILQERPTIVEFIQKAIARKQPIRCDLNFNYDGDQFKGEMAITPFISFFDFVYAYLIEIYDHTQPILTDRLKVWSHSVQKMAHDIKQPLSSISLNLKALQMRLTKIDISGQEEIRDDIQMMRTEMEKVRQITNNFLKFVNLETLNFQWIDLHATIRESLNRFKPLLNKNLHIDFEFDSDITSIWADPRQLEIVLHTIIENAIDAMEGQGHIRISTTIIQKLETYDQQFVQIEIADNGPGIETSIKENIFEPFFTTKMDGTGMGLAIAKKIIEDHNGNILIYSKEKIGTVVRILLPKINS